MREKFYRCNCSFRKLMVLLCLIPTTFIRPAVAETHLFWRGAQKHPIVWATYNDPICEHQPWLRRCEISRILDKPWAWECLYAPDKPICSMGRVEPEKSPFLDVPDVFATPSHWINPSSNPCNFVDPSPGKVCVALPNGGYRLESIYGGENEPIGLSQNNPCHSVTHAPGERCIWLGGTSYRIENDFEPIVSPLWLDNNNPCHSALYGPGQRCVVLPNGLYRIEDDFDKLVNDLRLIFENPCYAVDAPEGHSCVPLPSGGYRIEKYGYLVAELGPEPDTEVNWSGLMATDWNSSVLQRQAGENIVWLTNGNDDFIRIQSNQDDDELQVVQFSYDGSNLSTEELVRHLEVEFAEGAFRAVEEAARHNQLELVLRDYTERGFRPLTDSDNQIVDRLSKITSLLPEEGFSKALNNVDPNLSDSESSTESENPSEHLGPNTDAPTVSNSLNSDDFKLLDEGRLTSSFDDPSVTTDIPASNGDSVSSFGLDLDQLKVDPNLLSD